MATASSCTLGPPCLFVCAFSRSVLSDSSCSPFTLSTSKCSRPCCKVERFCVRNEKGRHVLFAADASHRACAVSGGQRVFVYRQTAERVEIVLYRRAFKLISSHLMPTNGHSPDPSLLPRRPRRPRRGRRHGGSARTRLPPCLYGP